jgi:hypothetical protein
VTGFAWLSSVSQRYLRLAVSACSQTYHLSAVWYHNVPSEPLPPHVFVVFSELSGVLWTMVFRPGVRVGWPLGPVCTAVCFALWAVATAAIVIMVEGLCCFLHTLRLHW